MRLIDADESVQHLKEDAELALEIKESAYMQDFIMIWKI